MPLLCMSKLKLILDCDPGHDDAVAILMAATYGELLGITTVSGNVSLDKTTHNALITTQILGLDVPVYAGCDAPLTAKVMHAPDIHGASGLGGPVLPDLTREAQSVHAVDYLINTIREQDDVWLIAVGPLTNVALALRKAPDIAKKLKGISIMGGSNSFGNRTPVAEFNIWADPEAADIVFKSGAHIIMCGLNLTHQFMIEQRHIEQIRALNLTASTFVADMFTFFANAYKSVYFGDPKGPLHDPCAVLAVTHPQLFSLESRHVAVELRGELTRGMTVVDERELHERVTNTELAIRIDAEQAFALLINALKQYD